MFALKANVSWTPSIVLRDSCEGHLGICPVARPAAVKWLPRATLLQRADLISEDRAITDADCGKETKSRWTLKKGGTHGR